MEVLIDTPPEQAKKVRRNAQNQFQVWEQRTQLVKQQVAAASAHNDAKTIRLKALRLAKEAADKDAAPVAPSPKPRKRALSPKT
jgi:hypothetical protein